MAQWQLIIVSGSDAELASLSLTTALAVGDGGTGQTTLSSGQVLLGNGTSGINSVARGDVTGDSQVAVSGGTNAILGAGVSFSLQGDVASGSNLNDISDLSSADGTFIVGSATGWVAETGNTARTSLGLGTSDSPSFNGLSVTDAAGTASFAGSVSASYFYGDGSNLTGLPSAAINSYTNAANNRIVTSVDANTVNGEANLTFDGSTLDVTGAVTLSGTLTANGNTILGNASGDTLTINAQTIDLANIAAGTDNTVVVYNGSSLVTDEIDSRVWGTSLIDGAGSNTRVAYFSDANTLTTAAAFTYDGTDLTVDQSSYGTNAYIAGNLTVAGTASFENASSLLVADRFVLFNSGSASGDGGFIVQSESDGTGMAMFFDDSATRFALQMESGLDPGSATGTPDAYVAAVVDVDGASMDANSSVHQVAGNIMISGSEAWIYI